MRPDTYKKIRNANPHFFLPAWEELMPIARKVARRLNREQLITRRAAKILGREEQVDQLWDRKMVAKEMDEPSIRDRLRWYKTRKILCLNTKPTKSYEF